MNDLNVTTVQMDIKWEDPEANKSHIDAILSELSEPTDVVVLPEMFTTGFTMNPQNIAEDFEDGQSPTIQWMKEWAEKLDAAITGSVSMKSDKGYVNRMLWVTADGCDAFYDKRHLFSFANEDLNYTGGEDQCILNFRGWNICLQICYDLRFPVWNRNILVDGVPAYDALIYVANWPKPRIKAWETLLKARAIENQSYVVASNRIGKDAMDIEYIGGSAIIDPKGEYLYQSSEKEEVAQRVLGYESLKEFRQKFPNLSDADNFKLL